MTWQTHFSTMFITKAKLCTIPHYYIIIVKYNSDNRKVTKCNYLYSMCGAKVGLKLISHLGLLDSLVSLINSRPCYLWYVALSSFDYDRW